MPTEFAFRLSTYLTLALSCLCLCYAEWDLLPEATVITAAVLVSLGFSFWANGRYLLDLKAANRVGLVIGIIVGGWMTYQVIKKNSLFNQLPLPASVLPYLGPLLMILMPAKLFRPKHVGDWWAMQGIALAGACLASAMSEDEIFGIVLGLYAVSGATSLVLFYYRRTANTLPPVPNTDAGPSTEVVSSPGLAAVTGGRTVVRRVFGWLALSLVFALPLFFLTPRSQSPRWSFGKGRLETGFTGEQNVDLNRTGTLEVNKEVAFEVRVTHPDGRPKDDLSLNQRWRGISYAHYDNGRWGRGEALSLYVNGVAPSPGRVFGDAPQLDLGPNQIFLEYNPRTRAVEPVLSDPVLWQVGKPPPVSSRLPSGELRTWWQGTDGAFRPFGLGPGRPFVYRQINCIPPGPDPDLGPPFELAVPQPPVMVDPVAAYRTVRLPKLRTWTRELLLRLAKTDRRLADALNRVSDRATFDVAPQDYETVGRVLCDFLKTSPDYEYSLKLRRADKNLDPVEDFLMKSKSGHCERFAAALALMLRAVGVPAAYVLGFKGCEHDGDGNYVVRQEHAHAWVEVLVPRPAPPGFPFALRPDGSPPPTVVWHWLSLDPTPDGGADEGSNSLTDWLDTAKESSIAFFLDFIVGYNSDRRGAAVELLQTWVQQNWFVVLGIPAALMVFVVLRRLWRRMRAKGPKTGTFGETATGVDWFDQYLAVLKRSGIHPAIGATPAEYALVVSDVLRIRSGCAGCADVPTRVTEAFYLTRYAKQPLGSAERDRVAADITRLADALRASR